VSQIREVEAAWKTMIDAVAAKATTVYTGTVDSGTATTLVDAARTGVDWQWAVVVMTSGTNNGRWRVVTAWNDTTDTMTFHEAFPSALATGDTYSVTFAPLGGANTFLRRPHPNDLRKAELPAVIVSAMRSRSVERQATGNHQGSKSAVLTITTDIIAPYEDTDAAELVSDKLFEQVDQLRMSQAQLSNGVARFLAPNGEDEVSNYGEIGNEHSLLRVFWSVIRTRFAYNV